MNPPTDEAAALRVAAQYLAGHHCDRCSKEWITGASVGVLVHRCTPPRQARTPPAWSREAVIAEEREAWARRQLGSITGALEDELGDRALLPIDEEA